MLKSLIGATVLAYLSSCVVHVHVHEAPRETVIAAAEPVHESHTTTHAAAHESRRSSPVVRGTVVDTSGEPVRARVAIVGPNGSMSMTSDDAGRFSIESPMSDDLVVHASTEDGRVAVQSVHGAGDVRLVVMPGGTITIDFTGEQNMRCAVFQGDVRLEDFTLRAKLDRTQVIVPAGDIRLQVYGGGTSPHGGPGYTQDQHVTIAVGESKDVKFSISTLAF